jgi:hypothetical protein
MHCLSSIYSDTIHLHVSGLLVAHHQEVAIYIRYMTIGTCFQYIIIIIITNCNWADTQWQQYSTYLHTNSTQNIERNIRNNKKKKKIGKCGPGRVFASYTLAFALQLRKKHGKTSG